MSTGAIIMMIIGLGITWGGAAVCLTKALKKK